MVRKRLSLLFIASMVIAAAAIAACGDDDDTATDTPTGAASSSATIGPSVSATSIDNAELSQLAGSVVASFNAQNADVFTTLFTEAGLKAFFKDDTVTPQVVAANAADYLSPPLADVEILELSFSDDTGSFTIHSSKGGILYAEKYAVIRRANGAMVVDGFEFLAPDIPSGVKTVDVEGIEFAYAFTPTDVTSGNVAFAFSNAGDQPHEMFLVQVTDEFTIDALLAGGEDEEPPGVVSQIGGTFALPGGENNLVFQEPLASGKYVMICFIPDADDPAGTPHVAKGMHAAFTVP